MAKDGQGFYNLMPKKKKMLNLFGAKEATFYETIFSIFYAAGFEGFFSHFILSCMPRSVEPLCGLALIRILIELLEFA